MNKFSIFFDSGGGNDVKKVNKYWKIISAIFDDLSKKEYTSEVNNFHIALRVDGSMIVFGDPEGCSNLKYFKKKKTIENTISFGEPVLKNEELLSAFLKSNLLKAVSQMLEKLEAEKIQVKSDELIKDLRTKIEQGF